MKKLILFFLLPLFFISCDNNQSNNLKTKYYPLEHYTPLKDINGEFLVYTHWGEKLIYQNEIITNTYQNLIKVKRALDDTIGYVNEKNIIKEPIAKGVILDEILIYSSPSSSYSSEKVQVNPPVLIYIIDTNENGWIKLQPYNADGIYNLEAVTKIEGKKWVKWDKISTNSKEIEVIISIQHSLAEYRQASQDDKMELQKIIDTQKKFLSDDIISVYEDSEAIKFAEEVYNIIANNSEKEIESETNVTSGSDIDEDEILDIINEVGQNRRYTNDLSDEVNDELRSSLSGDTNNSRNEDGENRSDFYRPPPGR